MLLVSYNHAPFIGEAVQSILAQEVDTPFEIVVADDGSTDGTRDIIAQCLSDAGWTRFRFLDHSCRRGLMGNYKRAFEACTSRYVAVLEGDDYWIRPDKLAWHAAFLDSHPECSFSATNILVFNTATGQTEPRVPVSDAVSYFGPADLIAHNAPGNFSACFYRLETLRALPPGLFDQIAADWIVNICAARAGLLGYSHQPMSVYRQHPGGLWSGLTRTERLGGLLAVLAAYDALTDHAYKEDFAKFGTQLKNALNALGHPGTAPVE